MRKSLTISAKNATLEAFGWAFARSANGLKRRGTRGFLPSAFLGNADGYKTSIYHGNPKNWNQIEMEELPMAKMTVDDIRVSGKKVLVRCD
ncbi:MAG: hypothetical protein ACLSIR_08605, partial [Christensenellales bacterium]